VRETLLAPHNFTEFHMLKNHVDLLELRVVNDFEKGDDIRVTDLLQDGDFLLRLVLGRLCCNLSKATLLGETWDDFDSHIFACFEVASQLDFTMHSTSNFFNHFILVNELAACGGI